MCHGRVGIDRPDGTANSRRSSEVLALAHSPIRPPVPDADQLGQTEAAVLDRLDPPLNLQGRLPSPVRTRLTELRRHRDSGAAAEPSWPSVSAPKEPSLNEAERQFHKAMVAIYETAKRELGYNATRFLQMLSEQGGLATAKQLLWSEQPSDGFTTLWSHHRLDLTVEAHVLKQEYRDPVHRGRPAAGAQPPGTLRVARQSRQHNVSYQRTA
jgi:hypothetical protein